MSASNFNQSGKPSTDKSSGPGSVAPTESYQGNNDSGVKPLGGLFGDVSDTVISNAPPIELLVSSTHGLPENAESLYPLSGGALPVGAMLGHFKIEKFIGGGGMGRVYLAVDTALARNVAIKVLPRQRAQDSGSVARFMNEARSAARLNHEHIAQVYFAGEQDGMPFIAFEYVKGTNIRVLIEKYGVFALPQAINYLLQISHAIAHAASHGVVHRDVKPSNILITSQGQAKLIDMGLARLLKSSGPSGDLTASGVTLGTFDYISPEQARDPRNADIRSDIYSLGCTFFYMLTGQPPFPEGTVLQKLLQHQGDEPPDVRTFQPNIPQEVAQIIQKMMAKDPRQRYQEPGVLIDALIVVAEMLGLRPTGPSKIVWVMRKKSKRVILLRHLPWISSVSLLLVAVLVLSVLWKNDSRSAVIIPPTPPIVRNVERGGAHLEPSVKPPDTLTVEVRNPTSPIKVLFTAIQPLDTIGPEIMPGVPGEFPVYSASLFADRFNAGIQAEFTGYDSKEPSARTGGGNNIHGSLTILDVKNPGTYSASPPVNNQATPSVVTLVVDPSISSSQPDTFSSLENALANSLGTASIIELRFNGTQEIKQPISLTNRQLTLRSAPGFSPVLKFSPSTNKNGGSMITISGGSIAIEGLTLEMEVSTEFLARNWTLFDIPVPAKLNVSKCFMTIKNISQNAVYHEEVAFFRSSSSPGGHDIRSVGAIYEQLLAGLSGVSGPENAAPENLLLSTNSSPPILETNRGETHPALPLDAGGKPAAITDAGPDVFLVRISNSVLRGEATVLSCESGTMKAELENVLIVTALPVFVTKEVKSLSGTIASAKLTLKRVSVYSRAFFCRQIKDKESSGSVMPINFDVSSSVFCMNQKALLESLSVKNTQDARRDKTFSWTGKQNYFDTMPIYWWRLQSEDVTELRWKELWGNDFKVESLIPAISADRVLNNVQPGEMEIPAAKKIEAGIDVKQLPLAPI